MTVNTTRILNAFSQKEDAQKWLKKLKINTLKCIDCQTCSVPQLAQAMNISERGLHYKVKQETNLTPAKYIREQRLLKAKQLLENQVCTSVSAVSYSVGFQKSSYFSALFKKRFGKLPSSYLQL